VAFIIGTRAERLEPQRRCRTTWSIDITRAELRVLGADDGANAHSAASNDRRLEERIHLRRNTGRPAPGCLAKPVGSNKWKAQRYVHASDKRKGRAVDERWAQVASLDEARQKAQADGEDH
jgi:hypothetical protein